MKAIVLSMKAIRIHNPDAGLIQTEDLCKVHSTPLLAYQADFENKRRWLTYDFLTGRFTPHHPLWMYFLSNGIPLNELEFFIKNRMEPAICGFNYYLSSERFLDDDFAKYPEIFQGGNGTHKYADVEAVRIPEVQVNLHDLLKEAWERYHLPLALSEVHLACTREEQLRWFNETYTTVTKLKKEQVDFRAVTTWSFFGSFDWNSLLRKTGGDYEAGVFDIRSGEPRPTALASMIKDINMGNTIESCLLKTPGWWHRDIRNSFNKKQIPFDIVENSGVPPILILGASGSLGKAFSKICHTRGLVHRMIYRQELDITSQRSIENIIERERPWALINAIGFTSIDEAEKDPMKCFRVNTLGPAMLASVCHTNNVKMVTFSADQVFNGKKRNPYLESDKPSPINIYGQSKRKAEEVIMMVNPDTLIIRSSAFYNPWIANDPLVRLLNETRSGEVHYFPNDIIISPTYIVDLVNTTLDIMIDGESGIWHLSNQEEISQFQFVRMALEMAGRDDRNIGGIQSWRLKYAAERPHYSVLSNLKGISLPPLSVALEKYLGEVALAV
jgi:dTDP-4-dehydrorhamnose reductase